MSDDVSTSPPRKPGQRRGWRIGRLALKELKETLRDRRTIITLVAMPLLVYPILSLIFRTFLFSTLGGLASDEPLQFRIVVETEMPQKEVEALRDQIFLTTEQVLAVREEAAKRRRGEANKEAEENEEKGEGGSESLIAKSDRQEIVEFNRHDWQILQPATDEESMTLRESVESGSADVGIRIKKRGQTLRDGVTAVVISDPDNLVSRKAARYVKERLDLFNQTILQLRLTQRGARNYLPFNYEEETVESEQPPKQVSFAALVPLMLVLMTITGAVYPAIDLTAGERERGTLETLVAAPIPRISILMSKFIAVLTVAILTATVNIIGILATIWVFQLETMLAGPDGLTWTMIFNVFALLILFASFFSAVLLAVTSYARSFKEAQAYLIPIILLSLAPGLMALTPGLSLNGPLAVAPMVNILLLARDVLQNSVEVVPAAVAIASTMLYGCAAILLAAKIFGTDAILYGSQGSWKDIFTRPSEQQDHVPTTAVFTCLALLFPANFVLIGYLGRFEGALTTRLLLMGLFTFLTFMAFPWLVGTYQRVKTSTGFGLKIPRWEFLAVGVLLGVSLWPLVMSIITGWQQVLEVFVGEAEIQQWHDRLIEFGKAQAENLRNIHPAIIALNFALIPAICEEWFFRGFLLRSLLKERSPWLAILLSAVFFGLFHVLSNSVVAMDRLAPTTLVGLILGWLCFRSGSILPGVLLHVLHNGIVVFLAFYQPDLSRFDWFPKEGDPIPMSWILISAVVSVVTILFVQFFSKPADTGRESMAGVVPKKESGI